MNFIKSIVDMLPTIFIGCSAEALDVARAIQKCLKSDAYCRIWDQGAFGLSDTFIDALIKNLDEADFAIFIYAADDIVVSKGSKLSTVRDNVVFETGLFMGRLGRKRTYIIKPSFPIIRVPTDLAGVIVGEYDKNDTNIYSAVGNFCTDVRDQIRTLQFRSDKKSPKHGNFEEIHHVNLPVANLERSIEFYSKILLLREIVRMPYPFRGAWFGLPSNQQLHLIEIEPKDNIILPNRDKENFNPKDCHFALRVEVGDWKKMEEHFKFQGIRPKENMFPNIVVNQSYILDPDGHIIEINGFTDEERQMKYIDC